MSVSKRAKTSVATVAVVAALGTTAVVAPASCDNPPTTTTSTTIPLPAGIRRCPAEWDDVVLDALDVERDRAGVPRLNRDAKLDKAANARGITLATLGHLDDHSGPNGYVAEINRPDPPDRYLWSWVGENIHAYVTAAQVVASWMQSPVHKSNMLAAHFDDVGIGCGQDLRTVPFWSLILGQGQ